MIYIGDVHGKFNEYSSLLFHMCDKGHVKEDSIQVGDMGVGFPQGHGRLSKPKCTNERHRFIRGNHDNPAMCKTIDGFIPDGTIQNGHMFVGGADSIDKAYRVHGVNWWPDEECSIVELSELRLRYTIEEPRIMVTHDCPQFVAEKLFKIPNYDTSRTRQAFNSMFEAYQPEFWIFGHWHQSKRFKADGTQFICLGELETCQI